MRIARLFSDRNKGEERVLGWMGEGNRFEVLSSKFLVREAGGENYHQIGEKVEDRILVCMGEGNRFEVLSSRF